MSDEPRAPEPPEVLWGLWRTDVGRWASNHGQLAVFTSQEPAEAVASEDPSLVVALIGVHPDWYRRSASKEGDHEW